MISFLNHVCFLNVTPLPFFPFQSNFLFKEKSSFLGMSAQYCLLSHRQNTLTLSPFWILWRSMHHGTTGILYSWTTAKAIREYQGKRWCCKEQCTYCANLLTCFLIHWTSLINLMFKDKIIKNFKMAVECYIKHRLCVAT